MKAAIICTAIVLAAAAPLWVLPSVMAGSGAQVGPQRPAYHCEPACPDPVLMPPSLPPVRSFGVEYHGLVTVPEPGTLALFGAAVAGLAMVRRRKR